MMVKRVDTVILNWFTSQQLATAAITWWRANWLTMLEVSDSNPSIAVPFFTHFLPDI